MHITNIRTGTPLFRGDLYAPILFPDRVEIIRDDELNEARCYLIKEDPNIRWPDIGRIHPAVSIYEILSIKINNIKLQKKYFFK